MSSITSADQPAATEPLEARAGRETLQHRTSRYVRKVSTRDGWLGDYDYAWYVFCSSCKSDIAHCLCQAMYAVFAIHAPEKHYAAILRVG